MEITFKPMGRNVVRIEYGDSREWDYIWFYDLMWNVDLGTDEGDMPFASLEMAKAYVVNHHV